MVQVRVSTDRSREECIRVFGTHHLHHPFPGLGSKLF